MNYYLIAPFLLLRQPGRRPSTYTTDIDTIISDKVFLNALVHANPLLHNKAVSGVTPAEKDRQTLRRYFNRYCYRPTPFGLLSSVSLVAWGEGSKPLWDQRAIHAQVSGEMTEIIGPALSALYRSVLEPNPTLYRRHREFRFIRTELTAQNNNRAYLLQSIGYSLVLKQLLQFCKGGQTPETIAKFIQGETGCTVVEAGNYVAFLEDSQILLPLMRPNITGQHYLLHVLSALSERQPDNRILKTYSRVIRKVSTTWPFTSQTFRDLLKITRSLPLHTHGLPPALNLTLLRHQPSTAVPSVNQQRLQDALFALSKLCQPVKPPGLSGFIEAFLKHFEGQSVPLLAVMDPESGIGYPAGGPRQENLSETTNAIAPQPSIQWNAVQRFLLNKWHAALAMGGHEININEDELLLLPERNSTFRENGFSVLFRIIDGRLIMENGGGTHAGALAGRFSVADNEIHNAVRSMAVHEEQLNPDIIFAEVLHLTHPKTDNVNRREAIWSWELPVTAVSLLPRSRQLELADLFVSCEGGTVLLRSKKHNKVVIPRLTSAYNHHVNNLPLFRFLVDIGYQFGHVNYTLDMQSIFPGLKRYPRVVYNNVVLYPTTWLLETDMIKALTEQKDIDGSTRFNTLNKQLALPRLFKLVQQDRQLVFDQQQQGDVDLFISTIEGSSHVHITEVTPFETCTGTVSDDIGCQYNAFILPTAPINIQGAGIVPSVSTKVRRKFIPGSEWLYLKLYQPAANTNRLLKRLKPLLLPAGKNESGNKWFFVRYADPAPHIRIRFLIDPRESGSWLTALRQLITTEADHHLIREVQVDTYNRELERYAMVNIADAESHFAASSRLIVLGLITGKFESALAVQIFAMHTTIALIRIFITDDSEQVLFCRNNFESFRREQGNSRTHVELDGKYREWKKPLEEGTGKLLISRGRFGKAMTKFAETAQFLKNALTDRDALTAELLQNLIHMHLNRLFEQNGRYNEMVTYYFVFKYLHGINSRSQKKQRRS